MAFDPDKYLQEKTGRSGSFNPDAYLQQKGISTEPMPSQLESGVRGLTNILGFGPAVTGAIEAVPEALNVVTGVHQPSSILDAYKKARDEAEAKDKLAAATNPGSYAAGQLAQAAITAPLLPEATGIKGAAALGAGLGAAGGLGEGLSAGLSPTETAKNIALQGAAGGAIGGAASSLLKALHPETLYNAAINQAEKASQVAQGVKPSDTINVSDLIAGALGSTFHGPIGSAGALALKKVGQRYGNAIAASGLENASKVTGAVTKAFNMAPEALKNIGQSFIMSEDPLKAKLGNALIGASEKDDVGRNAVIFSLMQNPSYRELMTSVAKDNKE